MHPDMQRRLLHYLRTNTDKQYFLTTHSNVFLDNTYVDRVFLTSFDGKIDVHEVTSRAQALADLGYSVSDNLVSDLVILVEGPTDVPVIEEFLKKMGLYGKYDIRTWPLGGDIMDQLDLSIFAQSYRLLALVDRDPGSDKVRRRFIGKCNTSGVQVKMLSRYSIENYFSPRALREVFGSQLPDVFSEVKPDEKLKDQIHIDVRANNRKLAANMTVEELQVSAICMAAARFVPAHACAAPMLLNSVSNSSSPSLILSPPDR